MTRYVISDHHFYHNNIIEYTNRSFKSVREMNDKMIEKWNNIISKDDTVIYGGDLLFGSVEKANQLIDDLNGSMMIIKGNHDSFSPDNIKAPTVEDTILQYDGFRFWYTHRPDNIPDNWTQWKLHGHVHNDMDFIDYQKNRVNVSVEVLDYNPIPLKIITKALKTMNGNDRSKSIKDSPITDFEWYSGL